MEVFNTAKEWIEFKEKRKEEAMDTIHNPMHGHNEGDCEYCDRINTAPSLQNEMTTADPITDMEKYLHTILDDDPDTLQSKYDHS